MPQGRTQRVLPIQDLVKGSPLKGQVPPGTGILVVAETFWHNITMQYLPHKSQRGAFLVDYPKGFLKRNWKLIYNKVWGSFSIK